MKDKTAVQSPHFRKAEVDALYRWIQAGESASVIGMSGMGKSNLFNHLCDPRTVRAFFGDDAQTPLIVRVNFHYAPDFSDRSLYSLILEQIETLGAAPDSGADISPEAAAAVARYHDAMIDARGDALKVQRHFKLALQQILSGNQRKLALLFDQFDEVYQDADNRFFANLRGLRETYKYRLSYLVFTRDLLPNLAKSDPAREEFHELLASNVMGLRPYNPQDAATLVTRVSQRNDLSLDDALSTRLIQLSGGHAGLLRMMVVAAGRDGVTLADADETAVSTLLTVPTISLECQKIWRSLSTREQKALHLLLQGAGKDPDTQAVQQTLVTKGVLQDDDSFFSPVFAAFAQTQDPVWKRPLHFDVSARQVLVFGQPAPSLTRLEYRLFHELYDRHDELVLKDELIEAGWPNAQGGVSDEALTAALARLRRKIEPDSTNPRFLENVRNQGYMLKIDTT